MASLDEKKRDRDGTTAQINAGETSQPKSLEKMKPQNKAKAGAKAASAAASFEKDALLREVDEEVRREQLEKLWQQYGTYVMAAAAAIVIGVGGWKFLEYRQGRQSQTIGARYEQAMKLAESGKAEEAGKAFQDIARTSPAGYRALAELRLAAEAAKAGRREEAVKAYEELGKSKALDPIMRDFARLQAAMLRLDAADWTETQNRLTDLTQDSNPWRFSARELMGLAAYKAGNLDEARKQFDQLVGTRGVPPNITQRAQMMLALLTEQPTPTAAPTRTGEAGKAPAGETAGPAGTVPKDAKGKSGAKTN